MKMTKTWLAWVAVAGVVAGQAQAGYQITIKSASEGEKKGRHAQEQGVDNTVVLSADADKARIDFTEGNAPGAGKGGYLITTDAGKTFIMVSPQDKTYMKWDMESMMGMAGAMGGMMKMKVSDTKVEKILDESGESILGYPTRHYKFKTSYNMAMTIMGFKNEQKIVKEEEAWTTTKLDVATLGAWFNKMPKTQNEELDKLIQAEKGKMAGMPLKMATVQTSTDSQGKATVTRTSMSVTAIKKIGASDVAVDIPADYKEMNLFQGMAQEEEKSGTASEPKRATPSKFNFGGLLKKALESAQ